MLRAHAHIIGRLLFRSLPSYTSAATTAQPRITSHLLVATMAKTWRAPFSFAVLSLLVNLVSAEHSFENTAIVRTVDLGGSLVHVTTTYAVRALEDDSSIYTIALGEDEARKTSWIQAKVKGQSAPLELEHFGLNPTTCVVFCCCTGINGDLYCV